MYTSLASFSTVVSTSLTAPWLWIWLVPVCLLGLFFYKRRQARSQAKVESIQQKPVGFERLPYREGEISEILLRSPEQASRQTDNERTHRYTVTASPILACPITKRLPKNPVVVSCGKVFEKSALASYLSVSSNLRQDLGLSYTPGEDSKPFFTSDKGYGNPVRQHKVLEALLDWWRSQPQAVQGLAQSQPEFFFINIDSTPIIENLALLMPGSDCPEGLLERWYDPAVFFQDPVIDKDGNTIDLPAQYKASACTKYRYNDMAFCTAGPWGQTTVIDKLIWMVPREDETSRPNVISSFFDLSQLPESDQQEQAFVSRYYQDTFVDSMIQLIKPYLQNYADVEKLPLTCSARHRVPGKS